MCFHGHTWCLFQACPVSYSRLAYLAVEECTVCFSLKEKKKVSGNHNNLTENVTLFILWILHLSSLPLFVLFPHFPRYMISSIWQRYLPSSVSCCEEICLSPHGVTHDIMKKELSLVCHMKHSDEKSLKTKTFFPSSFCLFTSVQFALLVGESAAWENYTLPGCLGTHLQADVQY